MILDGIVLIVTIIAFIRGWKKGLLWAALSLVAVFVGILISLKMSHLLASYLFKIHMLSGQYTLLLSFIILFLTVMFVFRSLAKLMETILDKLFLGWVNKVAGGVIYSAFVLLIVSTFFWLGNEVGILNAGLKKDSKTYEYIEPITPKSIAYSSDVIPLFKNLYKDVESMIEKAGDKIYQ